MDFDAVMDLLGPSMADDAFHSFINLDAMLDSCEDIPFIESFSFDFQQVRSEYGPAVGHISVTAAASKNHASGPQCGRDAGLVSQLPILGPGTPRQRDMLIDSALFGLKQRRFFILGHVTLLRLNEFPRNKYRCCAKPHTTWIYFSMISPSNLSQFTKLSPERMMRSRLAYVLSSTKQIRHSYKLLSIEIHTRTHEREDSTQRANFSFAQASTWFNNKRSLLLKQSKFRLPSKS